VKFLRVWLLVVLAVLLPVRGAVAAAMLCPPPGAGTPSERLVASAAFHAQDAGLHAVEQHDHAADGHHDHAGSAHHGLASGDGHHDHASTEHDKCNLCSAFCSSVPLPSESGGVPEPLNLSTASFPDLAVPAPSFLSDGQERPPRSV
jgi:hypothetical protein